MTAIGGNIEVARTKIFLLFVFVELIIAMSFRSLRYSVFEAPPHKWLLIAVAWEIGLFAALIQFAAVRETFGIAMPSWSDLAMALGVSAVLALAAAAALMLWERSARPLLPAARVG